MPDGKVKLWTWQGTCFPLTSGTVDHAKSKNAASCSSYLASIRELVRRLGLPDDQFIWCSDSEELFWHGNDRTKYELIIPEKAIRGRLNPTAWAVLIGAEYTCPRKVIDRLAQQVGPKGDVDSLLRKRWERYKSLTRNDLWEQLFQHECAGDERDVIVSFPLNNEWILSPRQHSTGRDCARGLRL